MQVFYHGLLRKYIIMFGTLFNSMYIDRVDVDGNPQKRLAIPLSYGPKEWYLARLNDNSSLTKPVDQVVPRMSFELTGMRWAQERKMNTTNVYRVSSPDYKSTYERVMMPVPYDLDIELSILTRNSDDATRIIEQIVPRFTPELNVTLKTVTELEIEEVVPFKSRCY
jgi:hypothetical protein